MVGFFKELYQYHYDSNNTLLEFIKVNNIDNQRIIELMSHILNSTLIWFERIKTRPKSLEPWSNHKFEELGLLNKDLYLEYFKFLDSMKDDYLDMQITYRNTMNVVFSNSLVEVMFHVVNHGTHHRGQILQIIRSEGFNPPQLDFIVYKRAK